MVRHKLIPQRVSLCGDVTDNNDEISALQEDLLYMMDPLDVLYLTEMLSLVGTFGFWYKFQPTTVISSD